MADYIPSSDANSNSWAINFAGLVNASPTSYGLVAADATTLVALQGSWEAAYSEHQSAQNAAKAATEEKDDSRSALEEDVRGLVRRIQATPSVTDSQRVMLGITVSDSTLTARAMPASRPVATVDTGERLRHTIHFRDESSPTSKARPKGARGCEIWVKIGSAPTDVPTDMTFLALDTATPYLAEYSSADAGKMAYYMLRWVNTDDEKGPWSETVEATIPG